jgi:dTDP-4-amino-4,6-dideoxygalactose transaminase
MMQNELTRRGIQTGIHYPIPVHLLPAHADLGYKAGDFPEAEALANEELSLPMFAELTEEQITEVCTAVCELSGRASLVGAER